MARENFHQVEALYGPAIQNLYNFLNSDDAGNGNHAVQPEHVALLQVLVNHCRGNLADLFLIQRNNFNGFYPDVSVSLPHALLTVQSNYFVELLKCMPINARQDFLDLPLPAAQCSVVEYFVREDSGRFTRQVVAFDEDLARYIEIVKARVEALAPAGRLPVAAVVMGADANADAAVDEGLVALAVAPRGGLFDNNNQPPVARDGVRRRLFQEDSDDENDDDYDVRRLRLN